MTYATCMRAQTHKTTRMRLLSYNIQVAIGAKQYRHYLTQSWKHVLPHARRFEILNRIAHLVREYDVVALQETDAGSLRSHFINQTEYLSERARFPYWYDQINRDLGKLAQHSLGLLSKHRPTEVVEHRLPGRIPGRGAMLVRFGDGERYLILLILHLALGRRARLGQVDYISDLVNEYDHVIVMGDMNCQPDSPEMRTLLARTSLRGPLEELYTFPSWRPSKKLDHILVTPSVQVDDVHVLEHTLSDHLPIAMEIVLPEGVEVAS